MKSKVDTPVKSQETLAQVMIRIEMQLSQQANPICERKKGNSTKSTIAKP